MDSPTTVFIDAACVAISAGYRLTTCMIAITFRNCDNNKPCITHYSIIEPSQIPICDHQPLSVSFDKLPGHYNLFALAAPRRKQ